MNHKTLWSIVLVLLLVPLASVACRGDQQENDNMPKEPTKTITTVAPTLTGTLSSEALPDLVASRAQTSLYPICLGPDTELCVIAYVQNIGQADAPPFWVELNGAEVYVENGLAAGESTIVAHPDSSFASNGTGYATFFGVIVDSRQQVTEQDETNNISQGLVVTLTAPAPCSTATPTVMP